MSPSCVPVDRRPNSLFRLSPFCLTRPPSRPSLPCLVSGNTTPGVGRPVAVPCVGYGCVVSLDQGSGVRGSGSFVVDWLTAIHGILESSTLDLSFSGA